MAHLALAQALRRKVSLEEFGERVARELDREEGFKPSTVSEWERDVKTPPVEVVGAIARVVGWDPGYLAYGEASGAPQPTNSVVAATAESPRTDNTKAARKKGGRRR